jgi:hypothetical protein
MFDNANTNGRADGSKRPRPTGAPDGSLADREVPLDSTRTAAAVHAWLDGDTPAASARQASSREVEFWSRLNAETDRRRHMRTPAHVQARIMESLPESTPRVHTSWWRRPMALTPAGFAAAAAGLLAAGAAIGYSILNLAH